MVLPRLLLILVGVEVLAFLPTRPTRDTRKNAIGPAAADYNTEHHVVLFQNSVMNGQRSCTLTTYFVNGTKVYPLYGILWIALLSHPKTTITKPAVTAQGISCLVKLGIALNIKASTARRVRQIPTVSLRHKHSSCLPLSCQRTCLFLLDMFPCPSFRRTHHNERARRPKSCHQCTRPIRRLLPNKDLGCVSYDAADQMLSLLPASPNCLLVSTCNAKLLPPRASRLVPTPNF